MSKSVKKRGAKLLTSVAAPLESDSDDEFNVQALTAEAEASYKYKKRGARGRPSIAQTRSDESLVKSSRREVLNTIVADPLPGLLGLDEERNVPSFAQTRLPDSWRPVATPNTPSSVEHIKSEPNTDADNTATGESSFIYMPFYILNSRPESENDEEDHRDLREGQRPGKRPSRCELAPKTVKRARKSPSPCVSSGTETESSDEDNPIPSTASFNMPLLPPPTPSQTPDYSPKPYFSPPPEQADYGPFYLSWPDSTYSVQVPASINKQLREYQRDGVRFFHERWAQGRGGLMGDDMGLGKTIQVIAFLSAAFQKTGDNQDMHRRRDRVRALQGEGLDRNDLPQANKKWGTCLIVCPKTVVGNWEKELDTWGYFEYAVYHGDKELRDAVLKDFTMGRLDIVLTGFDTARTNIDLLSDLPWSMVFVDEVHRCKNPSSGITVALNKFRCQIRFGLTGTAIQNGYKELWTLLDWCAPGKVGTQNHWKLNISLPLADGQAHRATQAQVSKARLLAERLVQRLLPIFFLRRTKALIADQMPRKFDQVVFCPLAKTQLEVYKRFLDAPDVQMIVRKDEQCDCDSGNGRGYCCYKTNVQGAHWKDLILKYMQLFVEISNHIILICPGFKGETDEQRARRREYVKIAFPGQVVRHADLLHDDSLCGKWKVLSELLDSWKLEGENKVLIFSKSVKILEMLDDQMRRKSFSFCYMDGKTKQEDRMTSLTKFNNDPSVFVFLISTLVGGTGLNMTSANKVVIFDPNWNPAHDLQAMDRAYRFGQKRDVNVYRLLGAGALEELIYARQIYKQQQMSIGYEASVQTRYFEGVQGSKSNQGELFGLKNIFKLHETALATKMTIEKANLAEINWALSNMDSTADGTIKETLTGAERSLADFMLESSARASKNDPISKILDNAGVSYSHDHQNVLAVSHVEKNITSTAIAGSRREHLEAAVTLANEGIPQRKPAAAWPPKRKMTAELAPEERLEVRLEALIQLGLVKDRTSLAEFGQDFNRISEREQKALLLEADRVVARRK